LVSVTDPAGLVTTTYDPAWDLPLMVEPAVASADPAEHPTRQP
jgi:hypothetical protein